MYKPGSFNLYSNMFKTKCKHWKKKSQIFTDVWFKDKCGKNNFSRYMVFSLWKDYDLRGTWKNYQQYPNEERKNLNNKEQER